MENINGLFFNEMLNIELNIKKAVPRTAFLQYAVAIIFLQLLSISNSI